MAINALGNVPYGFGRAPRPLGLRPRRRLRGLGDLVQEQVMRGPRRLIPPGRRFLGDLVEWQQLPSRGRPPRFTPPSGFSGGRFRLGADVAKFDPSQFADAEDFSDEGYVRPRRSAAAPVVVVPASSGAAPKKRNKPKSGKKSRSKKPKKKRTKGYCKMVCMKGGGKRKMCWDRNGRLKKVPKAKRKK